VDQHLQRVGAIGPCGGLGRSQKRGNIDTVGATETAWARQFLVALQPHRAGVYVNFLDSDDDTSRVREAYGDDTYRRLAEVKAKHDPENVFHNNKNIQPATPAQ
jgi:hypothetical protein